MTRTIPRHRRTLRTIGLAVVPALLIPVALAAPSHAAEADLPVGLFGSQDPTYDGVYRQSMALIAYAAEGVEPPAEAIDWLLDQQCDDGGFQSFRAATSVDCTPSSSSTFSGPDSNSTAIAVNALALLGEEDAADAGIDFLSSLQQSDGGIAYYDGGSSDANSTALTAMAITAVGFDPADAVSDADNSVYDGLDALQIGCAGDSGDRGAYAYMGGDPMYANDFATVQATIARAGQALPIDVDGAASDDVPELTCPDGSGDPAAFAAGYLANRLDAFDGTIPDAFNPGGSDWGSTRFAVMSLAAVGVGADQLIAAWDQLDENQDTFTVDGGGSDLPGALAELILTAHAAAPTVEGSDLGQLRRQVVVGTTDTSELLTRLTATVNEAPEVPEDGGTDPTDDGTSGSTPPNEEVTNGGTELADTGSSSLPTAGAGVALAAFGVLMIAGARLIRIEDATTA